MEMMPRKLSYHVFAGFGPCQTCRGICSQRCATLNLTSSLLQGLLSYPSKMTFQTCSPAIRCDWYPKVSSDVDNFDDLFCATHTHDDCMRGGGMVRILRGCVRPQGVRACVYSTISWEKLA